MKHECTTRGLDLFFNVLLARLRDGREQRQSKGEKKPRPDGTEEESLRCTAPSLFFTRFPIFAIPGMISDSA